MRALVLRPGWHFVLAEDIAWLIDLIGPCVRWVISLQLRNTHGIDERFIDQADCRGHADIGESRTAHSCSAG